MNLFALVLAGGSGTRLWPYSRRSRPKQLLSLAEGESLLQMTVARLAPLVTPERTLVLAGEQYVEEIRRQLPGVPPEQIICEPWPLGTAPAAALGAAIAASIDSDATMLVLPADHVIGPTADLHCDLETGVEAARAGWLVTFGIKPSAPETGFGYIELGESLLAGSPVRRAIQFVEKPAAEDAGRFVAQATHLWNSGMFSWTAATFAAECRRLLPEVAVAGQAITALALAKPGREEFARELASIWRGIEAAVTIDHGLMEKSDRVACVPARFSWSDVGSWAAVRGLLPEDEGGNAIRGDAMLRDSRGNLIFSTGRRLIVAIGVDELVIVDTPDALLVCSVDRSQEVREMVRCLQASGRDDLL